jgi:hypothetical protein
MSSLALSTRPEYDDLSLGERRRRLRELDDLDDESAEAGEVLEATPAPEAVAPPIATSPANDAGAPGLCSECGKPLETPGRYTCSSACADVRRRRRGAERNRAARDKARALGALERPATPEAGVEPPPVITTAPGEPEAPLPRDWQRLAGAVAALAGGGLRVALRLEGVELVVSTP